MSQIYLVNIVFTVTDFLYFFPEKMKDTIGMVIKARKTEVNLTGSIREITLTEIMTAVISLIKEVTGEITLLQEEVKRIIMREGVRKENIMRVEMSGEVTQMSMMLETIYTMVERRRDTILKVGCYISGLTLPLAIVVICY